MIQKDLDENPVSEAVRPPESTHVEPAQAPAQITTQNDGSVLYEQDDTEAEKKIAPVEAKVDQENSERDPPGHETA